MWNYEGFPRSAGRRPAPKKLGFIIRNLGSGSSTCGKRLMTAKMPVQGSERLLVFGAVSLYFPHARESLPFDSSASSGLAQGKLPSLL